MKQQQTDRARRGKQLTGGTDEDRKEDEFEG